MAMSVVMVRSSRSMSELDYTRRSRFPTSSASHERASARCQAEHRRALDRFGARRHAQLPVGRDRLGLDRVARDEKLPTDLLERQVRRQKLKDSELSTRQ